jgi:heme ABC exporter ATP-binding subunit CcmA
VTIDFDRLEIDGVTRYYGRRRALHNVTFSCGAGEVVALLGPNGAGKSTLLAVISTLIAPNGGEVRYGSHTARSAGALLRHRLGWLGHELQVYPELTARENLQFFARLMGVSDENAAVAAALASSRLESRAEEPVSGFSRGMRQRLALERALIHRPRLILLDEPFTGLDGPSSDALALRLRALAQAGTLVLLATHDVDLADQVLDRAMVLQSGRLTDVVAGAGWRQAYRAATRREH